MQQCAEGVRKPDVSLFETAAHRCGASLRNGGWMVGDNPIKDIIGGRTAGLSTMWVNHGAQPDPSTSAGSCRN
ncbi:HAD hydrolase-like protein [Sphaerisporangium krabiense]|uniref:HAD hydrolase-like protein n=1 Tax=Sphaerisporangium krabiense TaxID=763782 RepID=UPI001609BCA3|nr:HAD hydrolase-like protein [Sphaerisporangium krabiense]